MRIGLAQMNASIGDLEANSRRMAWFYQQARQADVDLLVFPELALCGYPPERFVRQSDFLNQCHRALQQLAKSCTELSMIVGWPEGHQGHPFNAAALLQAGGIASIYRKGRLPAFHAFDETQYFQPGQETPRWTVHGLRLVPTICYDLWDVEWLAQRLASHDSVDLIVNLSASPLDEGKVLRREQIIKTAAQEFSCGVAYCNLVGQYQDLVFDGRSMVADARGQIRARGAAFKEDLLVAEFHADPVLGLQVK